MSLNKKLLAPFFLLITLCVGGGLTLGLTIRDGLERRAQSFLISQTLNDTINQLESNFGAARIIVRDDTLSHHTAAGPERFQKVTHVLRSNLNLLARLTTDEKLGDRVNGARIELALWEATAATARQGPGALQRYRDRLAGLEQSFVDSMRQLKARVAGETERIDQSVDQELKFSLYTVMAMFAAVALAAAALAFYVATSITKPLLRLIAQARAIADGNARSSMSPLDRSDEIGVLSQALSRMLRSLQFHICEIEQIAYADPMTGLPNKQKLLQAARDSIEARGEPTLLILVDFDSNGRIEDVFGANFIDAAVRDIAQRVHDRVAIQMPEARGDGKVLIARADPTRLAVLISGDTALDVDEIEAFRDGLLSEFAEAVIVDGQRARLTPRIGLAVTPKDAEAADALLSAANMARQAASDEPSGRIVVFDPAMRERTVQRRMLEERLGDALEREEFELHYQPKVACARPSVVGVEALIRWRKPGEGLVPPGVFIPVAEETGLIARIDDWVMGQACAQAVRWRDHGLDLSVAVNVSAARFEQDGFEETVLDCLSRTGLQAARLELELTETLAMADPTRTAALLAPLREQGVRISIDDFGAGYSSLSKLSTLPIDCVKIDRSLLPSDPQDRDTATIMEAAVGMARSLGLHTVAEGVETTWQHAYLQSLGCDVIQGFLFSQPIEPASLELYANAFDAEAELTDFVPPKRVAQALAV